MSARRPHILAVCGGSGSGKTTFARKLAERLNSGAVADAPRAVILAQDSYYIDQSARFKEDGGDVNFDHPDALEWPLIAEHLRALRAGRAVEVPVYDFATHRRLNRTEHPPAVPVIIVDGILILSQEILLPLYDDVIFLDVPEKLRFERRFRRDTVERGRTAEGVLRQLERQVKPMHDLYVQPSARHAHRVIHDTVEFDRVLEEVAAELAALTVAAPSQTKA
ncbi:MAG: uridine kinase [Bdellovibrionales bacterium]|nr:uridine kinase [Bdellovibrionales bacterium]